MIILTRQETSASENYSCQQAPCPLQLFSPPALSAQTCFYWASSVGAYCRADTSLAATQCNPGQRQQAQVDMAHWFPFSQSSRYKSTRLQSFVSCLRSQGDFRTRSMNILLLVHRPAVTGRCHCLHCLHSYLFSLLQRTRYTQCQKKR